MTYITWIDPILSIGIQELLEDNQEKGALTYELVETPKGVKEKIEKEYLDPMLCNLYSSRFTFRSNRSNSRIASASFCLSRRGGACSMSQLALELAADAIEKEPVDLEQVEMIIQDLQQAYADPTDKRPWVVASIREG